MGEYNFVIKQGATFNKTITWKDSSGTPFDLTGYSAKMQIRKGYDDDVLVELSTDNGKITINGTSGEIILSLTATETSSLDFSTAVYDLELTSPSGEVTRLLEGQVTLDKEVTK